jgi:cytochrome c oxidase subunit 4
VKRIIEHNLGYFSTIMVWVALIVLTVVTVEVAQYDLQELTVAVALLIASAKAVIVAMYFMHLKFESKLLIIMVGITILIFLSFIILTLVDYWTR